MPNLFDVGVRMNPKDGTFRGQCDICLAHQGLADAEDVTTAGGGWGTYTAAKHWIVSHLDRFHKDSIPLEASMALGTLVR